MQRFLIILSCVFLFSLCSCESKKPTIVTDSINVSEVGADNKQDSEGEENVISNVTDETVTGEGTEDKIAVYVCGAVVSPGVYYISEDAIKEEALILAGGFADGAATTYVNLAEKVSGGEQIYFPYEDELLESYSPLTQDEKENQGKININTATVNELMTLPGIGESKANSIIEYREEHGAFQSIEDITNIPGIKEGVYNNIKDYIVVD